MDRLPIDDVLPELLAALASHPSVVLRAETGAGKTTRVPPALLPHVDGKIVVLEPRRVAARAAARRMAEERGEKLGDTVGYQVRHDRVASAATRILVVTEGILVRMLADDPLLEGIGAVVLDEFHERSIHTDLSLALCRQVQREVRDDLKIVVMSATIDTAPVAAWLGDAPIVESAGRTYPVEVHYADKAVDDPVGAAVRTVKRALGESDGHVLVFMPGVGEIRRTLDALATFGLAENPELVGLFGDMTAEDQDAVIRPSKRRRVIVSTNVAETSLTIPGVTAVVDTGLARVMRLDSGTGLNRLEIDRISRASADQRRGRAGRDRPGLCYRLWTEFDHRTLRSTETPEIRRVDLAPLYLQLVAWGERSPETFDFLERPEPAAFERARDLLRALGAVDDENRLTQIGAALSGLPVHPRLGRIAVEGHRLGRPADASLAAALLAERDIFRTREERLRVGSHRSHSDVLDRIEAIERGGIHGIRVFRETSEAVKRDARQIERDLKSKLGGAPAPADNRDNTVLRALVAGYPDRVARLRDEAGRRGVMVGQVGVKLSDESAVGDEKLFVCVDVDGGKRGERAEASVRMASAVERDWLPRTLLRDEIVLFFDEKAFRVGALRRVSYADLVLEESTAKIPDKAAAAGVLAVAAARDLHRALPLADGDFAELVARVAFLNRHMPELALPPVDDAGLAAMLPVFCADRRSFDELQRAPLCDLLLSQLTWEQRQALEREAPDRLGVPTGSRIKLDYPTDGPPALAVRIQELFGLTKTPRVAAGRVAVVMHLLAPNYRPQQVTTDLESFWKNTYAEVRRELRQRYPKHAWPDDPMTAPPQRGARRG